jgi:hypothetical protein
VPFGGGRRFKNGWATRARREVTGLHVDVTAITRDRRRTRAAASGQRRTTATRTSRCVLTRGRGGGQTVRAGKVVGPPDVAPLPRMHDTSRSQQVDVRACYRCGRRNAPRGRLAGGSSLARPAGLPSRVSTSAGSVNETPAADRAVPKQTHWTWIIFFLIRLVLNENENTGRLN